MLYFGKTGRVYRMQFGGHRRTVVANDASQPLLDISIFMLPFCMLPYFIFCDAICISCLFLLIVKSI